ncbi:MAG: efflux transporter periplasmic adaptor subunit, partial [Gammaproteobacteria bacterium]
DNHAVLQPVRLGHLIDEHWLVLEGLKPGDRVIVEGFQKFAAGEVVDPVPWSQAVSASAAKEPTSPNTD